MKSLLEEDPSELMGLEEENDPMELTRLRGRGRGTQQS